MLTRPNAIVPFQSARGMRVLSRSLHSKLLFGLEPVLEVLPVTAAAAQISLVGDRRDLLECGLRHGALRIVGFGSSNLVAGGVRGAGERRCSLLLRHIKNTFETRRTRRGWNICRDRSILPRLSSACAFVFLLLRVHRRLLGH